MYKVYASGNKDNTNSSYCTIAFRIVLKYFTVTVTGGGSYHSRDKVLRRNNLFEASKPKMHHNHGGCLEKLAIHVAVGETNT